MYFLTTVGDVGCCPKVLDAAARFQKRPAPEEMDENGQKE